MDIQAQEQIQELMFWQAMFGQHRAAWHKAACAKKWSLKMHTTRAEVISTAEILVKKAERFGMNPDIVCQEAVRLLKATSEKVSA